MIYPTSLPAPLLKAWQGGTGLGFKDSDFEQGKKSRPIPFPRPKYSASFLFQTKNQVYQFYDLYRNKLRNASQTFTAQWTIEGIDDYDFTIKFIDELKLKQTSDIKIEVSTNIEVLDDMNQVILNKLNEYNKGFAFQSNEIFLFQDDSAYQFQ